MKYIAIVFAALCLGLVSLFFVNSSNANASPTVMVAGSGEEQSTAFVAQDAQPNVAQVAHYTFDEADGAVLNDHIVYNNGHASGKFWRTSGVRNNAIVMEEAQVQIANQPQLNHGLDPYSISTWVYLQPDSSIWIDKRDFQNQPKVVEGEYGGTW